MPSKLFAIIGWLCGSLLITQLLATDKPNVLFIAVDDMRCDLGCYGVKHVLSPNIDQLAASGVLFQRAYCQQAVCNPSRVSLMTGLRPDTTRVWDLVTDFRTTIPNAVTIPQHFRAHGYRAVAFGKIFHNTFPDNVSWDEPTHQAQNVARYSPANQQLLTKFKQQLKADGKPQELIERLRGPATEIQEQPDEKNFDGRQTLDAIEKMHKLAQQDQPFFLSVGYIRPHLPWITPKKYWDLYERDQLPLARNPFLPEGMPEVAFSQRSMGGFYELRGYMDYLDAPSPFEAALTEEQQRELRHGYYASVSFVDAQIGLLMQALQEMKLDKNTIVVLWSDHGWKLGEHRSWCKQTNLEIDTHAPLIVRVPNAPSNGKPLPQLVEFIDIYPTLCELAGIAQPQNIEGKSFAPLLQDATLPHKKGAISQFPRKHLGRDYMGYALRTDNYRYIEWLDLENGEVYAQELYDQNQDPDENVNLASASQQTQLRNQSLIAELSQQLWQTIPRPTFPMVLTPLVSEDRNGPVADLTWQVGTDKPLPVANPNGSFKQASFVNENSAAIELWWQGSDGSERSYGKLLPGERFNIRTRPGAVWVIKDKEQKRLGYFVIEETQASRVVGVIPK
jgi:iduronate 2-sulfatase